MLKDIKDAFADRVQGISWMDDVTKSATLEKSMKTISFIGFPEWLHQEGELDKYYLGVIFYLGLIY